jgi:ATP-dependent DNA helicase RecQ
MFRRDLKRRSEGNAEWNVRTLLLMQRAGLIRLRYSPPQVVHDDGALANTETPQGDDYFDRIDIQILMDAHQSPDIWAHYVDPQRAFEQQAMANGFVSLCRWLGDTEQPLCRQLEDFYRVDGVTPERSCGGCPGCRAQGRGPFTPTLSASFHVTGVVTPAMPKWMPDSQLLRVRYRTESYRSVTPRALIHNWRRWMVALLRSQQVQAVRASRMLLDEIQTDAGFKTLPFWCALEPRDSAGSWTELVLLMPEENFMPEDGYEVPARLIVAPETLCDPYHPYRSWWECDPKSKDLVDFEREV